MLLVIATIYENVRKVATQITEVSFNLGPLGLQKSGRTPGFRKTTEAQPEAVA